jgi:hypothetical protein
MRAAAMDDRPEAGASEQAVVRYKSILQRVIDNRPAGSWPKTPIDDE